MSEDTAASPASEPQLSAKQRAKRARAARRALLAEQHPDLSPDALAALFRQQAAERNAAEVAAAAARPPRAPPTHRVSSTWVPRPPQDGWVVGKEAWHFCRGLYRFHKIVLEYGEYSRLMALVRAGRVERISAQPLTVRVTHERTGTGIVVVLRKGEQFERVLRAPETAEETAARVAAEFHAAIAEREARAAAWAAKAAERKPAPPPPPPPAPPKPPAQPSRDEIVRRVRDKVVEAFPHAMPDELAAKVAKVLQRRGLAPP